MRIKIIHEPTLACIDGVRLDLFVPGFRYDVGPTLGAYLIVEGWAVPIDDAQPALLTSFAEWAADAEPPPPANLQREFFPPYYDGPPSLAADRRRRPRRQPT